MSWQLMQNWWNIHICIYIYSWIKSTYCRYVMICIQYTSIIISCKLMLLVKIDSCFPFVFFFEPPAKSDCSRYTKRPEAFREIMMKARRQRMGLPAEARTWWEDVFGGFEAVLFFFRGGAPGLVSFGEYPKPDPWDRYIFTHFSIGFNQMYR